MTRGAATLPAEFAAWVEEAFARAQASLTWSEIARALASLTQDYVQRRGRLARASTLAGRGKRAAFALYYAPRHYAVVRAVLTALGAAAHRVPQIVDLGCGNGVAGAAWAGMYDEPPVVLGVDPAGWVLAEARGTCRALGVPFRAVHGPAGRLRWPRPPLAVVAAWMVNELDDAARDALLGDLEVGVGRGDAVLVVEPLATRIAPWWPEWSARFRSWGGRADAWRCEVALPEPVSALGRSAGLDPGELGARTLWVPQRPERMAGAQARDRSASKRAKASR